LTLYEDHQRELKKWTTKAKDAEAEARALKLELLIMKSQLATMREKKEYYRQELLKALERSHHEKRSRRMNKGKRTFAMPLDDEVEILEKDPQGKALANSGYDSYRPHYDLNGYIPMES